MTWRVAGRATRDLLAILDEIEAVAGPATAERYALRFKTCLSRIADRPRSGAPRPGLGEYARIMIVRPYVFIYDHDAGADTTIVLRVLHSRRNLTERLLRRPRP
jgi:plasmid stabilization system protein ParE